MIRLASVPGTYSIFRYAPDTAVTLPTSRCELFAVTRTSDELSIVCESSIAPAGYSESNQDWRCFKVEGTLDFSLTGILSSIATPLAAAKISIFAVSTFDTDYILVKAESYPQTLHTLKMAGFEFITGI